MNNFITRTLTGIVFVSVLVGAICSHLYAFAAVFSLITAASLWEFCGLVERGEDVVPNRVIVTAGGVYLFLSSFVYAGGGSSLVFLPYLLFLLYALIAELYRKASDPIRNWGNILLGQLYCAGSFSLLNFLMLSADATGETHKNCLLVLSLFVFVWINDTGAFLVGSAIGKHRLFERISPKKSWEGFAGGLVFALLSSQVFAWFEPAFGWYNWLGIAATVVVFGTLGDLTESLLKRTLGVKDSGKLLPGHGGMLDRFDSVIMSIPAVYIYFRLFIQS